MSPKVQRKAVKILCDLGLSERRACRLAKAPRSSVRSPEVKLRQRMRDLSDQHRRFGHPRLHILLRREGFGANHKKTHRIYVKEGLKNYLIQSKRNCYRSVHHAKHIEKSG